MLPPNFQWLTSIGELPKLLSAGLQYIGVREYPTKSQNNPVIMNMAKELGLQDIYTNDEESWCALFINYLIHLTGKPTLDVKGDKYNFLRAKSLLGWGNSVINGEEQLGDIAVFNRPGGGHVAIIIGETPTTFVIFGGNQSNAVGFTEISKSRLAGARRYYATAPPASVKKYNLTSTGAISTNEK